MKPRIGIVLGSYSDVGRLKPGLDRLEALGIPFEICVASAHRVPVRLEGWLRGAEERGLRVIIAGAAAHLPGVVASRTLLPVIGVPFDSSPLHGQDSLYSIVQMPTGIPVATVGIDAAENAVILALQILASADPAVREVLRKYRSAWESKIEDQNDQLYARYPRARPGAPIAPEDIAKEALPPRSRETAAASTPQGKTSALAARRSAVPCQALEIDPNAPDVAIIEDAVDVLLGGGIVALPTDTVYGLAVDATNAQAVERLFRVKKRDPEKAVPVLVDSVRMFLSFLAEKPRDIDGLLDRHWPGPLTLVVRKKPDTLAGVSPGETVGVRMPDNMVALGLIGMLARPLASSSSNKSGATPATTPQEIVREFGSAIDMILDAGDAPGRAPSTVLSLVEEPFAILRQGALGRAALAELLGDRLA